MTFTPDDKIRQIAEAYALDASDFVRDHFQIGLDWSDASIQQLEPVMERFCRDAEKIKPTPEQVMQFAKMFGSYIGEIFRKNHGATWGMVELDGQRFSGLKATASGKVFWPVGRAQKRLTEGAENNVSDYYRALIEPA